MMHYKFSQREYVLGGLFALMAMFPIVTPTSFDVPLEGNVTAEAIRNAYEDREDQSKLRRLRWSILRDCAQREAAGETNACPDPNDYDALKTYWLPVEEMKDAADEVVSATLEQLSGYQKSVLRRAERNGQCPRDLDFLLPGFQALCEQAVKEGNNRVDLIKAAAERMQRRMDQLENPPTRHDSK